MCSRTGKQLARVEEGSSARLTARGRSSSSIAGAGVCCEGDRKVEECLYIEPVGGRKKLM
jgi:hypothetical protein